MTVDEAITTLDQMVEMGWIPEPEPVNVFRRYVKQVREVERKLHDDAEEGVINSELDYVCECAARAYDLAAAREGKE